MFQSSQLILRLELQLFYYYKYLVLYKIYTLIGQKRTSAEKSSILRQTHEQRDRLYFAKWSLTPTFQVLTSIRTIEIIRYQIHYSIIYFFTVNTLQNTVVPLH